MELGFLDVQTVAQDSLPGENVGVIRVRRNLGGSDVGMMLINRETTNGAEVYHRAYAGDANVRLLGHMAVNAYLAGASATGGLGDQRAARVAVGWRDQVWDLGAFASHLGDGFDPAVGFVITVKPGDKIVAGEPIASVYAKDAAGAQLGCETLARAITIGDRMREKPLPLVSHRVTRAGVEDLTGERGRGRKDR